MSMGWSRFPITVQATTNPENATCPFCGADVISVDVERLEVPMLMGQTRVAFKTGRIEFTCAKAHVFPPGLSFLPIDPQAPWRS